MTDEKQKAFWQRGFFRDRLKLSEWKWWVGFIFVTIILSSAGYSISNGTFFQQSVGPIVHIVVILYFTRQYFAGRRKKREKD